MELLAPAGGRDSLLAAIDNGADAVYLGYTTFGARAGAGNFNQQELAEAVRLCHLHHVRVHVTVNTLIKERELAEVYRVLGLVDASHADAVILQDLGAAALARDCVPHIARHASTQMAIHNRQGAAFLKREGFQRAVLARECSLSEIALAAETGIETEVFVHGAMCVGMSGQCLLSSMAGGRSGNRGRCAQPCRMAYDFDGRRGYWLSPRDILLRDRLPQLQKAGVTALKIEGRLKRPEYVAVVTRAYRKALDALAEGRFMPASEEELTDLRQAFHRGGFMKGYAGGDEDAGVIDPTRAGHGGVAIGRVAGVRPGFVQVFLEKDLSDGDGLQLRGRREEELTYAGPFCRAGETALVRLREGMAPGIGDQVARLVSADQAVRALAAKAPVIPVDAALYAVPGEPASLTVTDGESSAQAFGETVASAETKPLTLEIAGRSLGKTGDTPFAIRNLTLKGEGGFLPVAALNALRRDALNALKEKRITSFGQRETGCFPLPEAVYPGQEEAAPGLVVQSADAALGQGLRSAGADVFVYAPESYERDALAQAALVLPRGTWLALPVKTEAATLDFLRDFVQEHPVLFAGVVLGSIGQAGAGFGLPMAAGEGVPVLNSRAAAELMRLGAAWQTVSPELNQSEIRDLPLDLYPLVMPVYGRTRLMALSHCPARTALGLSTGHSACRLCESGTPESLRGKSLKDALGHSFPLMRSRLPEGCAVSLYNTLPLNLAPWADKLQDLGWLLSFTDETPELQLAITACFAALRRGQDCGTPLPPGTAGHFRRGVE